MNEAKAEEKAQHGVPIEKRISHSGAQVKDDSAHQRLNDELARHITKNKD